MSTTRDQALARLRREIREPTANVWSDARLVEILQDADRDTFQQIARIRNSGYGQLRELLTLPANATTVSLTPGTPPTALTYGVKAVAWIEHLNSAGVWNRCVPLQEADEFRFRSQNVIVATSDVPPLYRLRRPNFVFLPVCTADRNLAVIYRPDAVLLSATSTPLNCPDDRLPLVIARAKIAALEDIGEADNVTIARAQTLEDDMYRDYENPNAEGEPVLPKLVETGEFF